ncbi:MAG: HAMP domain-containing protein [Planctomycetes bacterium]|nr:HAMP domain-containing protein [Planctomycetota bacterium]
MTDALPGLFDAFSPPSSRSTSLGWLRSPADFALTAIAFLLSILPRSGVWRLPDQRTALARWHRARRHGGGGLVTGWWHELVAAAVRGGKTSFFRADSFVPRAGTAFMLLGVVAATAAALLAATAALRVARRAWDRRGRAAWGAGLLLAAGAGAVAWFVALGEGRPDVVVLALPVVASGIVVRDRLFGLALPSRILLVGVASTFLAYPLLWSQVATRDSEQLARTLRHLLATEESNIESMLHALQDAREDPRVRRALESAAAGMPVEGVAYHLWLMSDFRGSGHPCVVSVLDARDHVVDRFSLGALPDTLLLPPAPPVRPEMDDQLDVNHGDGARLRAVIGRVRIRRDGKPLGAVVFTAPDRLDMEVRGLHDGLRAVASDESDDDAATARPQFAELRGGAVLRASDPTVSRRADRFGPPDLLDLQREGSESGEGRGRALAWRDDDFQGYAQYTRSRGSVHAIRRARPGFGEAMLALSRVILLGVGLASVAALLALVVSLRGFRPQLHHRILVSYFIISVIPLVLLGLASARDARTRFERRLDARLGTDLARMRGQLERLGGQLHERADSASLQRWTPQTGHDTVLYDAEGVVQAASRPGLLTADLLPDRLPAEVYRATVLEKRRLLQQHADYAGRPVWFGYEPVLDSTGHTRATVGIPLLYDQDRLDEEVTVSGSVLMAAYLLTLVLVLVGAIYAANRIARPLAFLAAGTRRVATGDLDVELPGEGADEMGQLVANFNAMTRELRETTARAVQAERESAWRKMARQVAHEIKNPLTPMRLMIQQMEAEAIDPARAQEAIRRAAPVVLRQIETLTRIAGDFANFARLPKRRQTEIDPTALVEEVTALHSGTASRGVAVTCEVERGLPPIYWDEEELRRALINLVRNGIQAIRGRGVVRLKAYAAEREGRPGVAISITDTGVGIPRENLERLFEPHFSTKTSGMGLGLAIVRRIIQDSGGTIRVSSRVGRGTIFTLWWHTAWEGR